MAFKEKILLSSEEFQETVVSEGHARVHVDGPQAGQCVQTLHLEIGVIGYGETVFRRGVFCVWKKNGMQRVVVDARSINQRCRRPPSVRLCSGDGLARLELPPEMHLHVAQADVDNCFHRMRMPTEMQRWLSLLRISAANLGGVRICDRYFDDNTPIFPLLETLPVGFTWSPCFAQSAHEAIVEQHAGLKAVS